MRDDFVSKTTDPTKAYLFGVDKPPFKYARIEQLGARRWVSLESIEAAGMETGAIIIDHERFGIRRACSEKIGQAIFEGWMPYSIEFWEGPELQYQDMRYDEIGNPDGYSWRVLVKLWSRDTVLLDRMRKPLIDPEVVPPGITWERFTPQRLS